MFRAIHWNRPSRLIYTMGTSTRAPEEFIKLLKNHNIELVLDVRRFPQSRFCHFNRENLSTMLKKAGIEYLWLGKELGGYRQGGYEAYVKSQGFQQGLKALTNLASKRPSLILCAEKFPWRCHRRFISQELEKLNWQVKHII